MAFDPAVSFKPILYKIEGLNDSCRVLGDRTLIFTVLDILFSILTDIEVIIKIMSVKLKTMSHNFWSDRQFLVYNISNRKYRRDGRFDVLSAEK